MTAELLRQLPGVDRWLASPVGVALVAEYSTAEVTAVMRIELDRLRDELRRGRSELPDFESEACAAALRAELMGARMQPLRPVINATGIVIHTNLGRAPLADSALAAIELAARGYSNLEYDLAEGRRGSRGQHVEALLCELTGAEAALVVNNCASAVLLSLAGLAAGGEVVVSRGELIEIGGSFRMPDVIAASGARMVEVGTTNRTSLGDYREAIGEHTKVLLSSHPSNYRVVGFTHAPQPSALAALAADRGIPWVHDLGSGAIVNLARTGLQPEPTVQEAVATGAGLVTFSGDKMLGGPQAGIVLGRVELVERLRRHPLARAARVDKLSLAALIATLQLYRPPHDPWEAIPVLKMLSATAEDIRDRARPLVSQIAASGSFDAALVQDVGFAGGGATPMSELPTTVIELKHGRLSCGALAAALRDAAVPVITRINRDRVLIDLRTVLPTQEAALLEACGQVAA